MKENRDFKGVWIPKEIWLNTDLSIIEKVLLVEIDSLDNSDRGCFASNEYLANFVQLSEGRVANIISDLKKRKFIIYYVIRITMNKIYTFKRLLKFFFNKIYPISVVFMTPILYFF